jgi:hypothetical protein
VNEPVERADRNVGGDCEERKISYFSAVDLANAAAAPVAWQQQNVFVVPCCGLSRINLCMFIY